MRHTLTVTSVLAAGLFLAAPAFADTWDNAAPYARPGNVIGTDSSLPHGTVASNLSATDTHSDIAPNLPVPAPDGNGPDGYLRSAEAALRSGQTGLAQNALEMAETRMLDRSVPQGQGDVADHSAAIRSVDSALQALAGNNTQAAEQDALRALRYERTAQAQVAPAVTVAIYQ
jgi:hypothetical protein